MLHVMPAVEFKSPSLRNNSFCHIDIAITDWFLHHVWNDHDPDKLRMMPVGDIVISLASTSRSKLDKHLIHLPGDTRGLWCAH